MFFHFCPWHSWLCSKAWANPNQALSVPSACCGCQWCYPSHRAAEIGRWKSELIQSMLHEGKAHVFLRKSFCCHCQSQASDWERRVLRGWGFVVGLWVTPAPLLWGFTAGAQAEDLPLPSKVEECGVLPGVEFFLLLFFWCFETWRSCETQEHTWASSCNGANCHTCAAALLERQQSHFLHLLLPLIFAIRVNLGKKCEGNNVQHLPVLVFWFAFFVERDRRDQLSNWKIFLCFGWWCNVSFANMVHNSLCSRAAFDNCFPLVT